MYLNVYVYNVNREIIFSEGPPGWLITFCDMWKIYGAEKSLDVPRRFQGRNPNEH